MCDTAGGVVTRDAPASITNACDAYLEICYPSIRGELSLDGMGGRQTLIIRVRYGESSPASSLEVGQSSIQNRIYGIESFTPYTIGSGINFIFDFVML
jgi:hypothetical protein